MTFIAMCNWVLYVALYARPAETGGMRGRPAAHQIFAKVDV